MPPAPPVTGSRPQGRVAKRPSKERRTLRRALERELDVINAMPSGHEQYLRMLAWKKRHAAASRMFDKKQVTDDYRVVASPMLEQPTAVSRSDHRPRERREQRHAARLTSSADSGDSDSGGPGEAGLEEEIDAVAQARQAAWATGSVRRLTEQFSDDLERLYDELREVRRGADGLPFAGRSASYISPPTRPTRPWRGE
jgi:hypothetical protein